MSKKEKDKLKVSFNSVVLTVDAGDDSNEHDNASQLSSVAESNGTPVLSENDKAAADCPQINETVAGNKRNDSLEEDNPKLKKNGSIKSISSFSVSTPELLLSSSIHRNKASEDPEQEKESVEIKVNKHHRHHHHKKSRQSVNSSISKLSREHASGSEKRSKRKDRTKTIAAIHRPLVESDLAQDELEKASVEPEIKSTPTKDSAVDGSSKHKRKLTYSISLKDISSGQRTQSTEAAKDSSAKSDSINDSDKKKEKAKKKKEKAKKEKRKKEKESFKQKSVAEIIDTDAESTSEQSKVPPASASEPLTSPSSANDSKAAAVVERLELVDNVQQEESQSVKGNSLSIGNNATEKANDGLIQSQTNGGSDASVVDDINATSPKKACGNISKSFLELPAAMSSSSLSVLDTAYSGSPTCPVMPSSISASFDGACSAPIASPNLSEGKKEVGMKIQSAILSKVNQSSTIDLSIPVLRSACCCATGVTARPLVSLPRPHALTEYAPVAATIPPSPEPCDALCSPSNDDDVQRNKNYNLVCSNRSLVSQLSPIHTTDAERPQILYSYARGVELGLTTAALDPLSEENVTPPMPCVDRPDTLRAAFTLPKFVDFPFYGVEPFLCCVAFYDKDFQTKLTEDFKFPIFDKDFSFMNVFDSPKYSGFTIALPHQTVSAAGEINILFKLYKWFSLPHVYSAYIDAASDEKKEKIINDLYKKSTNYNERLIQFVGFSYASVTTNGQIVSGERELPIYGNNLKSLEKLRSLLSGVGGARKKLKQFPGNIKFSLYGVGWDMLGDHVLVHDSMFETLKSNPALHTLKEPTKRTALKIDQKPLSRGGTTLNFKQGNAPKQQHAVRRGMTFRNLFSAETWTFRASASPPSSAAQHASMRQLPEAPSDLPTSQSTIADITAQLREAANEISAKNVVVRMLQNLDVSAVNQFNDSDINLLYLYPQTMNIPIKKRQAMMVSAYFRESDQNLTLENSLRLFTNEDNSCVLSNVVHSSVIYCNQEHPSSFSDEWVIHLPKKFTDAQHLLFVLNILAVPTAEQKFAVLERYYATVPISNDLGLLRGEFELKIFSDLKKGYCTSVSGPTDFTFKLKAVPLTNVLPVTINEKKLIRNLKRSKPLAVDSIISGLTPETLYSQFVSILNACWKRLLMLNPAQPMNMDRKKELETLVNVIIAIVKKVFTLSSNVPEFIGQYVGYFFSEKNLKSSPKGTVLTTLLEALLDMFENDSVPSGSFGAIAFFLAILRKALAQRVLGDEPNGIKKENVFLKQTPNALRLRGRKRASSTYTVGEVVAEEQRIKQEELESKLIKLAESLAKYVNASIEVKAVSSSLFSVCQSFALLGIQCFEECSPGVGLTMLCLFCNKLNSFQQTPLHFFILHSLCSVIISYRYVPSMLFLRVKEKKAWDEKPNSSCYVKDNPLLGVIINEAFKGLTGTYLPPDLRLLAPQNLITLFLMLENNPLSHENLGSLSNLLLPILNYIISFYESIKNGFCKKVKTETPEKVVTMQQTVQAYLIIMVFILRYLTVESLTEWAQSALTNDKYLLLRLLEMVIQFAKNVVLFGYADVRSSYLIYFKRMFKDDEFRHPKAKPSEQQQEKLQPEESYEKILADELFLVCIKTLEVIIPSEPQDEVDNYLSCYIGVISSLFDSQLCPRDVYNLLSLCQKVICSQRKLLFSPACTLLQQKRIVEKLYSWVTTKAGKPGIASCSTLYLVFKENFKTCWNVNLTATLVRNAFARSSKASGAETKKDTPSTATSSASTSSMSSDTADGKMSRRNCVIELDGDPINRMLCNFEGFEKNDNVPFFKTMSNETAPRLEAEGSRCSCGLCKEESIEQLKRDSIARVIKAAKELLNGEWSSLVAVDAADSLVKLFGSISIKGDLSKQLTELKAKLEERMRSALKERAKMEEAVKNDDAAISALKSFFMKLLPVTLSRIKKCALNTPIAEQKQHDGYASDDECYSTVAQNSVSTLFNTAIFESWVLQSKKEYSRLKDSLPPDSTLVKSGRRSQLIGQIDSFFKLQEDFANTEKTIGKQLLEKQARLDDAMKMLGEQLCESEQALHTSSKINGSMSHVFKPFISAVTEVEKELPDPISAAAAPRWISFIRILLIHSRDVVEDIEGTERQVIRRKEYFAQNALDEASERNLCEQVNRAFTFNEAMVQRIIACVAGELKDYNLQADLDKLREYQGSVNLLSIEYETLSRVIGHPPFACATPQALKLLFAETHHNAELVKTHMTQKAATVDIQLTLRKEIVSRLCDTFTIAQLIKEKKLSDASASKWISTIEDHIRALERFEVRANEYGFREPMTVTRDEYIDFINSQEGKDVLQCIPEKFTISLKYVKELLIVLKSQNDVSPAPPQNRVCGLLASVEKQKSFVNGALVPPKRCLKSRSSFDQSSARLSSVSKKFDVIKASPKELDIRNNFKQAFNSFIADTRMLLDNMKKLALLFASDDLSEACAITISFAESYQNTPDVCITFLNDLEARLQKSKTYVEAGFCAFYKAIVIANVLYSMFGSFSNVYQQFVFCAEEVAPYFVKYLTFQSASPESSQFYLVSDADTVVREWEVDETFNYMEFATQLTKASTFFKQAKYFEYCQPLLDVVASVYRHTNKRKLLSSAYAELRSVTDEIISFETRPRILCYFYRVKFIGPFNGLDETMKQGEWIFKEGPECNLPVAKANFGLRYRKYDPIFIDATFDQTKADKSKNYILITNVSPYFKSSIPENEFEKNTNVATFFRETPFVVPLNNGDSKVRSRSDDIREQWKRRVIFTVAVPFPFICLRQKVVNEETIKVAPIDCAIELIQNRTNEISKEISALKRAGDEKNFSNLFRVLQGSVRLQVNGGVLQICQAFLAQESNDDRSVHRLRKAIKKFVSVCKLGLANCQNGNVSQINGEIEKGYLIFSKFCRYFLFVLVIGLYWFNLVIFYK